LARRRPEWNFKIWGKAILNDFTLDLSVVPPNVDIKSPYSNICDIGLESCSVWLYTSEWDGVPNLLLELACLGVPIVGTNKGGGCEVINRMSSYIIEDIEDISEYERGVSEVLNRRNEYITMAHDLKERITKQREFEAFLKRVAEFFS
jgi:glycosyltransferase involved in cell wall biosynthesis